MLLRPDACSQCPGKSEPDEQAPPTTRFEGSSSPRPLQSEVLPYLLQVHARPVLVGWGSEKQVTRATRSQATLRMMVRLSTATFRFAHGVDISRNSLGAHVAKKLMLKALRIVGDKQAAPIQQGTPRRWAKAQDLFVGAPLGLHIRSVTAMPKQP